MTIQQEFWADPNNVPDDLDLPDSYVKFCKPDYYVDLAPVSNYLLNLIKEWAPRSIFDLSILELGCNSGRNLARLSDAGASVVGIEINPECIGYAAQSFPQVQNNILVGSIEELLPQQQRFDIIFTQGVLMHIPHETIDHVAENMAAKADMIITVEVEVQEWRNVKFSRNYGTLFMGLGMKMLHTESTFDVPYISLSTARVFSNID